MGGVTSANWLVGLCVSVLRKVALRQDNQSQGQKVSRRIGSRRVAVAADVQVKTEAEGITRGSGRDAIPCNRGAYVPYGSDTLQFIGCV